MPKISADTAGIEMERGFEGLQTSSHLAEVRMEGSSRFSPYELMITGAGVEL